MFWNKNYKLLKSNKNHSLYKKNSKIKIFIYIILLISILLIISILYNLTFHSSFIRFMANQRKSNNNDETDNNNNTVDKSIDSITDYNNKTYKLKSDEEKQFDYENNKFAILTRNCSGCGFFSHYIVYLGCLLLYLNQGYIPIIELSSFPNVFNSFNISLSKNINPYELLFNQHFEYTLKEVNLKAKNIEHFSCKNYGPLLPNEKEIYKNQLTIDFYHYMAEKYMPIKQEIIEESNIIRKKLFGNSKNILGILARGTDYFKKRPIGHSIPPKPEIMIQDVKKMNENNKYDYFYLATEDYTIRNQFINEFGDKLKYYQNITYEYKDGYIGEGENTKIHNIEFQKMYLLSLMVLSKCIDLISARCSGTAGVHILSGGFRKSIVYFLGQY